MAGGRNIFEGSLVRLRAVEPTDAEPHFEWNQDSQMQRRLDYIHVPQSRALARQWAERESTRIPEGDDYHFEVETLDGTLVGSVAGHHCDRRNGTFEAAVAVMREHQRKGYAREAVLLLLRYYFQELRYQKATFRIAAYNQPSIALCERLGCTPEGRLRSMVYTDGQYFDEVVYGMTIAEFNELHPEQARFPVK